MPVNTAVALLPPSPTRLQYSLSSGDNGPDSTSFQDTLQRASAPQDDPSSAVDDDSSTQNTLAPSKKDPSTKTTAAADSKASQKSKAKKTKAAADEDTDETSATSEEDKSVTIEAAKDATDDAEDKHGGKSKDQDKAESTEVAGATPLTAAETAAAQAAAAAATAQKASEANGKTEAEPKTSTAVAGRTGKGQPSNTAASVKKAGSDQGDEADGEDTDAATQDAAEVANGSTKVAAANLGATTTGKVKAVKKASASADVAENANASTSTTSAAAAAAVAAVDGSAAVAEMLSPEAGSDGAKSASPVTALDPSGASITAAGGRAPSNGKYSAVAAAVDPADKALATSEAQFADTNHSKIVSAVHGQLLPDGGTMQIRLDPAELGSLQINVQVKNGAMTATFETSNADTTRLLSHSLGDLRTVLEQAGVTVDKIHVQQSAKPDSQSNSGENKQEQSEQNPQAKQEQQRRELLQRMWKKLSGGDPLDLTA